MRIWWGYGSEHSMNLVMIGRFASVGEAESAKELIDKLATGVQAEVDAGRLEVGEPTRRFSQEMIDLLTELNLHALSPGDLEQLVYDTQIRVHGDSVVIRTDEVDVAAHMKILLDRKARIEIFSAHVHEAEGDALDRAGIGRRG
ncbi:hypothetical protein GCM10010123_20290 [Pilimelia anulata]|uniref:Uncharacterized protein n=1 Tax=Pilimelia anulata TaxID=53371 RepID=A0A8J3B3D2_9ACTN|nr:DUF6375 family protein [Pilimelia anulata]GGJ90392.1 hypothetical protein GCM10010123_20290 [Pilimelia anulata]